MRTETVKIKGMTCGGCVTNIEKAINALPGVHSVVVSLNHGEASVVMDESLSTLDGIKAAITKAGYEVNDLPSTSATPPRKGGCCCS